VDKVDHGDHDPPWWTWSVQDHRGPPYDIFLMFTSQRNSVSLVYCYSSKKNFHSRGITPASGRAASAPCVLCALAVRVFFAYHCLHLVHPDVPFSFPKHPAPWSRPIASHLRPPPYLLVTGVRCNPTKLSALGAAFATPPLPVAWIRPLASQNACFVVCPHRHFLGMSPVVWRIALLLRSAETKPMSSGFVLIKHAPHLWAL